MPHGPPLSRAAAALGPSVFAALQSRIEARRRNDGSLIPLHIGDTYLDPSPAVLEAAGACSSDELRAYGSPAGLSELSEALAARSKRDWVRSAKNVHVTCGATQALLCATRALLDPGDEVLVLAPYWPLIRGIFSSSGVDAVELPVLQTLYHQKLSLAETLAAALGPRTRAIYFASPNNPNGYILTEVELDQIALFARQHNLWVFSDEVYADYAYERPHHSIADVGGMHARTVVAHSFSKSHGLAGVRIGYLLSSEEVVSAVRRFSNYTLYNVPVAMQRAALAALGASGSWQEKARGHYRDASALACERLSSSGVAHHMPHGGSFVFCDFEKRLGQRTAFELLEAAIDRGVLLAPGEAFGKGFERCCRICFTGVDLVELDEGLKRLALALDDVA